MIVSEDDELFIACDVKVTLDPPPPAPIAGPTFLVHVGAATADGANTWCGISTLLTTLSRGIVHVEHEVHPRRRAVVDYGVQFPGIH